MPTYDGVLTGSLSNGRLKGRLSTINTITGKLSKTESISGILSIPKTIGPETYTGSYEFTPTTTTQTALTEGFMLTRNITINPIPSNYGLITWDGTSLTVS